MLFGFPHSVNMGFPRNRVPSNLTVLWMGHHSQQRIPRGAAPKENHGAAIHNNAGKQHGQRMAKAIFCRCTNIDVLSDKTTAGWSMEVALLNLVRFSICAHLALSQSSCRHCPLHRFIIISTSKMGISGYIISCFQTQPIGCRP